MITSTPLGIAYPIQRGANGYFNESFSTVESIKDALSNLILTPKKTRLGRPEYGSSLYGFLFEQNNDVNSDAIASVLEEDIEKWIPSIELISVEIVGSQEYSNTISLIIKYKIKNTPLLDELTL